MCQAPCSALQTKGPRGHSFLVGKENKQVPRGMGDNHAILEMGAVRTIKQEVGVTGRRHCRDRG